MTFTIEVKTTGYYGNPVIEKHAVEADRPEQAMRAAVLSIHRKSLTPTAWREKQVRVTEEAHTYDRETFAPGILGEQAFTHRVELLGPSWKLENSCRIAV
jgi:hypothetical protein